MAGAMHPPFSHFLPEEKKKTGRARSKREKEGYGGNDGGPRLNERRSRNDFPRAIGSRGGLHCMDQLLFLLPHPGGCSGTAFTGLLFPCVPDERRRSAGRHFLEAFPLLQGSSSGKRSWSIRHRTNSRSISLREGSHSGSANHSAAVPVPPLAVPSFSLLDRARPVFSFSSGRKRENGGVHCTSHLHG